MKKNSMAIIGVVAFVLAVAVGYAWFSETINVNGIFTKDNIIKETKVFANEYDLKKTRTKKDINIPINTKEEQSTDVYIGW